MAKYILKRILIVIPTLIGVSFIVFLLLHLSPGDAALAKAGPDATKETIEAYRQQMGLNDPFLVQYGRFLKNFLLHFNLGTSYQTNQPVSKLLLSAFPNTLKLAASALAVAVSFGLFFGIVAAMKRGTLLDSVITLIGMVGLAMPIFWTGLLLILLFAVQWKVLPASGFSTPKQMILPSLALGFQSSAIIMRMTRSSMLEILDQDYIRTARAKGLKETSVILIHALKNAMVPVVTTIGLQMGSLLGGSILTETIFSIPGVGRLMVESVKTRDYPIILGGVMLVALSYSIISIVVDILYGYINPRIRAEYR